MKRRIIWLMVSSLMALSLVLAACAPKVAEEEKEVVTKENEVVTEEKEVVTEKKEVVTKKEGVEMVVDALGRLVPKPQYGGVLNLVESSDPAVGFSRSGLNTQYPRGYLSPTNEPLLIRDRLKGTAGTGEWGGADVQVFNTVLVAGRLAESWEIVPPDTLKFKIRKGIHWQDRAPTYGMELTAEDVVYTYMGRLAGKWARSGFARSYGVLRDMTNPEKSIYIDPDDPRTVVFKSAPGQLGVLWFVTSTFQWIEPKALGPIEGEGFGDWRGVVGTGPFLLTDYVMGSSLTWQRNPNYWAKDELHPQNQLPYLDRVKAFIIPDLSTQYAALRTGKIDIVWSIEMDEAESLRRTNPELQLAEEWGPPGVIAMRHDRKPFNDVRVRQAMLMSIDHDEIIRDLYKGKGYKFWWPAYPVGESKEAFVPLEEMPEIVQEMYGYHPDKAKRLLAEAGYPNGFTTSVTVSSAAEKNIDLASIVAAYWAKVGVTLTIDIKEPAVYSAITSARTHPAGAFEGLNAAAETLRYTFSSKAGVMNWANVNEPLIEKTLAAVTENYFNWAEVSRITREAMPELHKLAPYIFLGIIPKYTAWQPWIGMHGGKVRVPDFYVNHIFDYRTTSFARHAWIDQELKRTMGR